MRKTTILLLLLVTACTERGRTSQVGHPDPRVMSLHDVTTELVVALGATDRLVGIADLVDPSGDVAAAVAKVPRVGGLESVLDVHPAIVLGLSVVAEQDPELVKRLRQAGVDVYLAAPSTLEDVYAVIRSVAGHVRTE